jgi:uncharacterized protein (TIGR00255 family)
MTGFARAEGANDAMTWHWEVRSVNGRGLDIRLRLPPGLESLEPRVREVTAKHLTRGNVQIALFVKRMEGAIEVRVNEAALAQVLAAARRVRELTGGEPVKAETLLSLKGVLELAEPGESEAEAEARASAVIATLDKALAALVATRLSEGARLATVLLAQLFEIERLVAAVASSPARAPEAIRERIRDQVRRILEASSAFDETRLHQEAVLLATRADVAEELERLGVHVAAARELIAKGEGAGRRLDFLAQELNREANTLCSKAADNESVKHGLELKAVIDQLREQVQNIE